MTSDQLREEYKHNDEQLLQARLQLDQLGDEKKTPSTKKLSEYALSIKNHFKSEKFASLVKYINFEVDESGKVLLSKLVAAKIKDNKVQQIFNKRGDIDFIVHVFIEAFIASYDNYK